MATMRRIVSALFVSVLLAAAANAAPPEAWRQVTTPEGRDCQFAGAHDNYIVSTCANATGVDNVYLHRCDVTDVDADCVVLATIKQPYVGVFTNAYAWITALATIGNSSFTAIATRVTDPANGYEALFIYYCSHRADDNAHPATCRKIYGIDANLVSNKINHATWTSVGPAQHLAVVYAASYEEVAAYTGPVLYRCAVSANATDYPSGSCALTDLFSTFNTYNYAASGNLTVAFNDYFFVVGDPAWDNWRGRVFTYDCSNLALWWRASDLGYCSFVQVIYAAEPFPNARFGGSLTASPVGTTSNKTSIIVGSTGHKVGSEIVGGYTTLLCDPISAWGSGACLRVQFNTMPLVLDNGDANVNSSSLMAFALTSVPVADSEDSIVYHGLPYAHYNVGEVQSSYCVSGVLCTRNREVLYYEGAPASDLLGSYIAYTPSMTVVGSNDNRAKAGGTYILEVRGSSSSRRRAARPSTATDAASAVNTLGALGN